MVLPHGLAGFEAAVQRHLVGAGCRPAVAGLSARAREQHAAVARPVILTWSVLACSGRWRSGGRTAGSSGFARQRAAARSSNPSSPQAHPCPPPHRPPPCAPPTLPSP